MSVKKIELTISDDIFLALNEKPEDLLRDMKIFSAVRFFETGKLSLGKAAELAGISKVDLMELLARQGISVYNYAPEELGEDVDNIQKARKSLK